MPNTAETVLRLLGYDKKGNRAEIVVEANEPKPYTLDRRWRCSLDSLQGQGIEVLTVCDKGTGRSVEASAGTLYALGYKSRALEGGMSDLMKEYSEDSLMEVVQKIRQAGIRKVYFALPSTEYIMRKNLNYLNKFKELLIQSGVTLYGDLRRNESLSFPPKKE